MNRDLGFENDNAGNDGIDRRGMLECMAWVGTGLLWSMSGGIPTLRVLGQDGARAHGKLLLRADQRQPHRFFRAPNKDVAGTLRQTVARINALGPRRPCCCTRAT